LGGDSDFAGIPDVPVVLRDDFGSGVGARCGVLAGAPIEIQIGNQVLRSPGVQEGIVVGERSVSTVSDSESKIVVFASASVSESISESASESASEGVPGVPSVLDVLYG
jgi:hypothetical protein